MTGTCFVALHEVGYGSPPDYEALQPCFAWAPVDVIKHTFAVTTRYVKNILHLPLRKLFRSRFIELNVHCHRKPVAMDTVYSNTSAIDDRSTIA